MFHIRLKEILDEYNFNIKKSKFDEFYTDFKAKKIKFEFNFKPEILKEASFCKICKVLRAKDIPKYKNEKKEAMFLHSIAHIEYSAIDLALDDCYRFSNLPYEYYEDWLEVASDEFRHFSSITRELAKLGYKYGDFEVHDGLFFAMKNTQHSLLERMAILHKHMEASGLDANYYMLKKISNDTTKENLKELLQIILDEEVSHVKKGNKWFKFSCEKEGTNEDIFLDIVLKHYPKFKNIKKVLNVSDRLRAGFSQEEINKMKDIEKQ